MPIVSQGAQAVLTLQVNDPTTTEPADPSALQLQVILEDVTSPSIVLGPISLANLIRTGTGAYRYNFSIPSNFVIGRYQIQWLYIVNDISQFNFDQLTIVAPSSDTQTGQSAVKLSSDPHVVVEPDSLSIKFDVTPKAISVYAATYSLFRVQGASYTEIDYDAPINYNDNTYDNAYTLSGSPAPSNIFVGSPFLPIQSSDYNSISRVIKLNFSEQLVPNAQYMISITGLVTVSGHNVADIQYLFSVPDNVLPSVSAIEAPVLIEDHSILQTPFTSLDIIAQLNPTFYLISTDPGPDLIFPDASYNNGRITVTFSSKPDALYVNPTYFVLQSKPLSRQFNRWTTIPGTIVSADPTLPNVYIDAPSMDATPMYNQPGSIYYQSNCQYRLKMSKAISANNQPPYDNLEKDEYIGFLINPTPFLVDPEVIQPYFSEASLYEISLLVYDSSQEIVDFFDDGQYTQHITPTIQSTLEDFVIANVCCNLMRIYDFGNGANQLSVELGDLKISQNNPIKSQVNRSNATTWCELAGVIRNEIYSLSSRSGMKAVMKGSRHWNPIPKRRVEYQEWRSWGNDRDSEWKQWDNSWGRRGDDI